MLPDGRVYVGQEGFAVVYDPVTHTSVNATWATDPYGIGMFFPVPGYDYPTVVALSNGKVLVRGSGTESRVYTPGVGYSVTSPGLQGRWQPAATLLPNGKALVANGSKGEVFDPATNTWSYTGNVAVGRANYNLVVLPNGKVLAAGGNSSIKTAELYDPATNQWTATGSTNVAHAQGRAARSCTTPPPAPGRSRAT